jgi:hypothetical protein
MCIWTCATCMCICTCAPLRRWNRRVHKPCCAYFAFESNIYSSQQLEHQKQWFDIKEMQTVPMPPANPSRLYNSPHCSRKITLSTRRRSIFRMYLWTNFGIFEYLRDVYFTEFQRVAFLFKKVFLTYILPNCTQILTKRMRIYLQRIALQRIKP